jgi:hypothetical protein
METLPILLTRESDEEACNVDDIGRVACGIVIHFICLSRLILDDIKQDVDSRVRVFRSGTIAS